MFAAALIGPIAVWQFSGDPISVLVDRSGTLPPGQRLYVISKLAALQAIALVVLQLSLALLRATAIGQKKIVWSQSGHRLLGTITVFAVVVHVATFVAATSTRNQELALPLLLPLIGHGYYRTMISVGSLALWLSMMGIAIHLLVGRFPGIRRLHPPLMMLTAVLAIVHSYGIGSESNSISVMSLYVIALLVILALWTLRRSRLARHNPNRSARRGSLR